MKCLTGFRFFRDPEGFRLKIKTPRGEQDLKFYQEGLKQMVNKLEATNQIDENGNPSGGTVKGIGLSIEWQNGPRREVVDGVASGTLKEPNGAFVEDAIVAAKQRLEFFQTAADKKFACRENALAITKLEEALHWLDHRTADRAARGVEGLNEK